MLKFGSAQRWIILTVSAGVFASGAVIPTDSVTSSDSVPAQKKVNFSRDVLPIFSDKCFLCHGPDVSSRMAGLRLDLSENAFADRNGRFAIVPGKPEESLVVQRINHATMPMPPVSSTKTLTEEEIDLITRWIAEGAEYSRHWSFELLPSSVDVPSVASEWPRDEIDNFILSRLDLAGLSPSPEADKLRWLRRVTLDLTGLPPSEEAIELFLSDADFEKSVDGLLASPHYGERIATEWLDAARYADSYGYQSDLLMPTWPYRDWVVRAFNDNLPYDEFLTWQLAGDLLDEPTREQRLATAFNRLHRQSNEGGSIALEFKTTYASDRVETFGTAMLGLTIGCAKCHDHKFDPVTQEEYYKLFAYFNSIKEYGLLLSTEIVPTPSLLLPNAEQEKRLKELQQSANGAREHLERTRAGANERFRSWLSTGPVDPPVVGIVGRFSLDEFSEGKSANAAESEAYVEQILPAKLVEGKKGKGVAFDGDSGIAVRGLPGRERWDEFTWAFWVRDPGNEQSVVLLHRTGGTDVGFCGFDLILEDGFLTARVMRHWPGNAVAVRSKTKIDRDEWTHVGWSYDGAGRAAGLRLYLNGELLETEVLNDRIWKTVNAYGDLSASRGDWSFAQRFRDLGFKGGRIDELVFADRALSTLEVAQLYYDEEVAPQSKSSLREYFENVCDPATIAAAQRVRETQEELAKHENSIYEIQVMEESPVTVPAYLLARGAYDAPRNDETRVERGVPASLPSLATDANDNRLGLANWLTAKEHPLTSRVAVNRIWQMLFGSGLVETSENFGLQGSQPTHPELLDYLSREFVDSGWDVKALLKKIVLSSTYRQDSALTPELSAKDPMNNLYARGPSYRLPAEIIRDMVLASSGLLERRIGGTPVNPYQPAGIWRENNTMSPGFRQSTGSDLYRRSIYSTWKRTAPAPNMMLFDATAREACAVRRPSTNTPLQALVLLNDVQFVEAARVLAEHVLQQDISDDERISKAFVRLAGRKPTARETEILIATLIEQTEQFKADISGAIALIDYGDRVPDKNLRATELAAMTVTVQTIMNSDAVVWKR